jgi:periplasmic protein TonB
MPGSGQRTAVREHRRETLSWPVLLSLVLHLTVFVSLLLIIPPAQPPPGASDPLTVGLIVGDGPAEAQEPPAPAEATAAPDVPPPLPVQQAEIPPPTPAPAPNVLPPPPPAARVRPPQRAAARAPVNPVGAPAQATEGQAKEGQNAASRAGGANMGAAWMGKLKQWWDQHSFYPNEASRTNEGGNVKVRIVIAPDGQVTSIQLVQGSGMSVLDAAAIAVFRNARLPPFPPGTPAPPADVVVTLHYRPADGGG